MLGDANEATGLLVQVKVGINEIDHLLRVDRVVKNDVWPMLIQINGIQISVLLQALARIPSALMGTAFNFALRNRSNCGSRPLRTMKMNDAVKVLVIIENDPLRLAADTWLRTVSNH